MEKQLRLREIHRIRIGIERDGYPRLQMLFLVMLTGAAGFLASFSLLATGMHTMWERYLAAVSIAYLVFLGLLWLWLRTKAEDYVDLPDITDIVPSPRHLAATEPSFTGCGGTADGGGASGTFEIAESDTLAVGDGIGDAVGDVLGSAAEADEIAIPLIVIVLTAAAVLSSLFVVYSAPLLFAELLVDGMLAASLYKRLRRIEQHHWLETALRRTVVPFLLTAFFAAAAGWAMAQYAPGAHSIGSVLLHRAPVK